MFLANVGKVTRRETAAGLMAMLAHSHGHVDGHASTCPVCAGARRQRVWLGPRPPDDALPHAGRAPLGTVPTPKGDYAFEVAGSSVRFGMGVSREVGMDAVNLGLRRVLLMTDPHVRGACA